MKKKVTEETAVTLAAEAGEAEEELVEKKPPKQSLIKTISGVVDTAQKYGDLATEIYSDWIKPVRDNWSQIKRRLSVISTLISILFFILYVPFLLFNKIYKDLHLGWDIALYVCIGVYITTVIALLIVTLASGKTTSIAMEKKRKKISKIILFIVRIASLAIGITALVISATAGEKSSANAAMDTIAIVFAVMSIIFTAFPLLFGGIGGFVKWLISPAKMKFKFSFVALEWHNAFTSEQIVDKNMKKLAKRYGERIGRCLDSYFLPMLGNKYIKTVDEHAISKLLEGVPAEDLNMCEWITKRLFDYAEECGYVDFNPCENLELYGDITKESKVKKASAQEDKPSVFDRIFSVFGNKQ